MAEADARPRWRREGLGGTARGPASVAAAASLSSAGMLNGQVATAASHPLYFVNWWVDTALIGGLSIVAWLVISAFSSNIDTKPILALPLIFTFLVNLPHFSATVYRLYQSPEHTRQFPVTSWGLPLILLGAVLACFWLPQLVAPYFLMLYVIWSPYHYSGQTVGLTMVYAKRSGFPIGRRERLALSGFVFSAFVYGVIHLKEIGFTDVFGMPVPLPLFPGWLDAAVQAVMATAALTFAAFAAAWCLRQKRMLPPIVLLPALAHFVWFVPGTSVKTFFVIIPLFHSLQYLLVALVVQLKRRMDVAGAERSWRRIRVEALRWGTRNIIGGVLLFIGIPLLFVWLPLPFLTVFGIVAAAVNIHHFFVDGVIWKLRDASNASALTINIAELSRPPVGAPGAASPAPA
jgi:hypothetical protein